MLPKSKEKKVKKTEVKMPAGKKAWLEKQKKQQEYLQSLYNKK